MLSLDVSSGILVPLHDPDTNMVFLCGKGDRLEIQRVMVTSITSWHLDRYIQFVEVADKDPWFVEGLRHTGEQIKVREDWLMLLKVSLVKALQQRRELYELHLNPSLKRL